MRRFIVKKDENSWVIFDTVTQTTHSDGFFTDMLAQIHADKLNEKLIFSTRNRNISRV